MPAMATQQVVVNCDTNAEVTQLLAQVNAWIVNNPLKIESITTTGRKITVLFKPYEVIPPVILG